MINSHLTLISMFVNVDFNVSMTSVSAKCHACSKKCSVHALSMSTNIKKIHPLSQREFPSTLKISQNPKGSPLHP